MLLALMLVPFASQAQETLTVHDGTTTNGYVPVYGFYADAYLRCQMVYPAEELSAMTGGTISSMTFYASESSVDWGVASFEVKLTEIESSTLSSFDESTSTSVYTGSLSISGNQMTVTFNTPYTYNGGNLLVEVDNLVEGSYVSSSWYGESVTDASVQGYSYSAFDGITGYQRNFLPKTTFTYESGGNISCYPVKQQKVVDSLTTSVSLSLEWSNDARNDGASIDFYILGETDTTLVDYSNITLLDSSAVISGLLPNTFYTIGIVVNCGGGDLSRMRTVTGRTSCGAISLPYTVGFENSELQGTTNALRIPHCWTRINSLASGYNYYPYSYTSSVHSGSRSLYFNASSSGTYADTTGFILPELDVTTFPMNANRVVFWAKGSSSTPYTILVGTMSDTANLGSFFAVDTITVNSSTYTKFTVPLTAASATDPYVAFIVPRANTSMYIDDLTLEEIPACLELLGGSVDTVTSSTITLTWVPNPGNATATYSVYKVLPNGRELVESNIADTFYTVTGLDANTVYIFGVQANCPNGESVLQNITGRTSCGAEPLPFIERFDAAVSSDPCWRGASGITADSVFNGGSLTLTTPQWNYTASTYCGLDGGHYYRNVYGTSVNHWLITPAIDLSNASTAQVSFDVALTDYSNAALPDENGDTNTSQAFMVIVSTDGGQTWSNTNATVWQNVTGDYTYASLASVTYQNQVIDLSQYVGDTIKIAFYCQSIWTGGDNDLHIDNIIVSEVPTCQAVTGFAIVPNLTSGHTATFVWQGEASNYQIEYKKTTETEWTTQTVNDTTATLTDLNPTTAYMARVKALCGNDESLYSETINFTTTVACVKPSNLDVRLTPGNGTVATVYWSDAIGSAWQICINGDTNYIDVTDDTLYTFDTLTPETTYTVKVRTNCTDAEDGYSAWTSTVTFTPTNSYIITVNDGTSTNGYVPVYGYYTDNYSRSQFIVPGEQLENMAYGSVRKMTFYSSNTSVSWGAASFKVYLAETSESTISSLADWNELTEVYSGTLSIVDNKMEIQLDTTTPFVYMGGNLLVGVNQTVSGTYSSCSWYGVNATGASMGGYGTSINQQNFLPKVSFMYVPGEQPSCLPISNLAVIDSLTTDESVTLTWRDRRNESASYDVYQITAGDTTFVTTVSDSTVTISDLGASSDYTFGVRANCGDDTEVALRTVRARTACGATPLPYAVDFTTATEIPYCWDVLQSYSSYSSSYPYVVEGDYLYFYGTDVYPNLIRLPFFNAPANALEINITGAVDEDYVQTFEVGYLTNPDSASSFTALGTITATNPTEYNFNTSNVIADSIWLALRLTAAGDNAAAIVTDIEVLMMSDCVRPAAMQVDSVTHEAVTLTWNSTGAPAYEVRLSTNASGSNPIEVLDIADTTTTIHMLAPSTTYYTWVRANCGSNTSQWRQGPSFLTLCGENPCFVTIYAEDSYGDGWNGATISITRNGAAYTSYTMASQNLMSTRIYDTASYAICASDTLVLTFNSGSYDGEITINLDYAGLPSSFAGNSLTSGQVLLVANGCPTCYAPRAIAVDSVSQNTVTVHWTPFDDNATAFVLYRDTVEVATVTGETSYTFTGLIPNKRYNFSVATICEEDTTSAISTSAATDCGDLGSCDVIVDMTADYINVWEPGNNWIEVISGNTVRDYATLPYGYNAGVVEIAACIGDSLRFDWHAGTSGWAQYDHFTIFNANGDTLYQGSGLTSNTRLVDTLLICPSCAKPAEVALTAATSTSATFAVTPSDATAWLVTLDSVTTAYTTSPFTLTGLLPGHNYSIDVKAVCTIGDTSLAKNVRFATACEDITIPWTEDFETYAQNEQPACWFYIRPESLGNYSFPFVSEETMNSVSSNMLYSRVYHKVDSQFTVTPQIPLPANKIHLTFNAYTEADYSNTVIDAGIMTNPADAATYMPLLTIDADGGYQQYELINDNLTRTDTVYLAFRAKSGNAGEELVLLIDNINVTSLPDCARPLTIAISDTTSHSATVTWANTGASSYQVFVNDSLYGTATTNTMNLTGLSANSLYNVKVRAICTDTSIFSPVASFRTECGVMTMPVSEDFESYEANELPTCWTRTMTVNDASGHPTPSIYNYSYYAHSGVQSLQMRSKSGNAAEVLSPEIGGAANAVNVSFWYYGSTNQSLEAGIVLHDTVKVPILNVAATTSTATRYTFNTLDSLATDTNQVFRVYWHVNSTSTTGYTGYLDDVMIEAIPECSENFIAASVDRIGGDSAYFNFETGLGRNVDATYTISLMNAVDSVLTTITDSASPVILRNLIPETTYHVSVALNCSGSVTAMSDTVEFTTRCANSTLVEISPADHSGGSYIPVYTLYNHSISQTVYPDSLLTAGIIQEISVNCSTTNSTLTGFQGRIWLKEVPATMTSISSWIPTDSMTLVYDGDLPLQNGWVNFTINPFSYSGQGNLVFCMMADGPWTSGYYFYRHSASAGSSFYYYNDNTPWSTSVTGNPIANRPDIRFDVCAGAVCATPEIDTVSALETEITMTFSSEATNFEVAVVEGTAWSDNVTPVAISNNTYTFTGLNALTTYTVGVRALCDNGGTSTWATRSITTLEHPCLMPTNVAVSNITLTSASIDWTPAEAAHNRWAVKITGPGCNILDTVTVHPYPVNNLTDGTEYSVQVMTICSDERSSDFTEVVTFSTLECQPVTGLATGTITATTAVLNWNAVAGSTGRYEVNYGMAGFPQGSGQITTVNGSTTVTLEGLESETMYDAYVRVYCAEGVASNWSTKVTFETSRVGINDVDGNAISLFPNPASTTVTLTGIEGAATVTVVDMNGRETGKWNVENGKLTIDVSDLAQGAYFVRITGEQVNAIRKLIVR